MVNLLAVFVGGGVGASLRYLIGNMIAKSCSHSFPLPTLFINVFGSFLLGFLFALFAEKSHINMQIKLFLAVGVCGGFTTFSTFSVESMCLLNSGKIFQFWLYIILSFSLCILGALIGAYCAKYF